MQQISVAVITSAAVVAILVATPGIIVSSQIAFGQAPGGGLGNPNSNVGGINGPNAMTQPLKNGGVPGVSGPANGQGVCYGQGELTNTPGVASGNTQLPNGANAVPGTSASDLAHQQHITRDANCPASPGFPSGH